MKTSFELVAEFRDAEGKGASRRLRRANKVPAILYGGHREPRALALDHTKLMLMLENERFYSTIISLRVGDVTQAAVLRDVQRHPARNAVLHVDLQRVLENEKIRIAECQLLRSDTVVRVWRYERYNRAERPKRLMP